MPIRKAAIAQLCSTNNKLSNLISIAGLAGIAKREGACMLCLPECFGFMSQSADQTLANAEPPLHEDFVKDGKNERMCIFLSNVVERSSSDDGGLTFHDTQRHLKELEGDMSSSDLLSSPCTAYANNNKWSLFHGLSSIAKASGLWISAGGMHESGAPPSHDLENQRPRVYNSHVVIDPLGKQISTYRKIHLFDVEVPHRNLSLRESTSTAPGSKLIVIKDTPIGNIGLSTCYDIRFPEMYVDLVQTGGAEVILVPSAFTVPTGKAHWHTLLKARAIETQCYILAAAQVGRHNEKRESYGHSLAVDPWGEILVDAGGYDDNGVLEDGMVEPRIIICEIDRDKIFKVREGMPVQKHRGCATFSF